MESEKTLTIEISPRKLTALIIFTVLTIFLSLTYIQALMAFEAPSQNFPIKVVDSATYNAANVSTSTFAKGTPVKLNCSVSMALSYVNFPWSYDYFDFVQDSSYRVIVSILDSNKRPVYLASYQKTISRGDIQLSIFQYNIASNAASGTYTMNILLWSDWLPSGKSLSPSAEEVTFTVS